MEIHSILIRSDIRIVSVFLLASLDPTFLHWYGRYLHNQFQLTSLVCNFVIYVHCTEIHHIQLSKLNKMVHKVQLDTTTVGAIIDTPFILILLTIRYLEQDKNFTTTKYVTFWPSLLFVIWHLKIQFQRDPFTLTEINV